MPDAPGVPGREELSARPGLVEAYRLIAELTARVEQVTVLNERLAARVEDQGFVYIVAAPVVG